jgi:two-component system chemotaxis sensor kinase CheA
MSIDLDDEILQDFLVEAGEIVELLGEQLVELEQSPEDYDLLNAIFRGFHTVKGGAGFLAIDPLVNLCHAAEDVFDVLRKGERKVNSSLMDVILQVVDIVKEMMDLVRSGEMPEAADEELIGTIRGYAKPESEDVAEGAVETVFASPEYAQGSAEDPVEKDFEAMLAAAQTGDTEGQPTAEPDEITEEEFENILDALHGKGSAPKGEEKSTVSADKKPASGDITEDEFEALLDQMHGKGKFGEAKPPETESEITPKRVDKPKETEVKAAQTVPEVKKPVKEANSAVKKKAPTEKKAAKPPTAETSIRVDTQRLDEIMNMVGELVLVRNRLERLKAQIDNENVSEAIANLDVVTADLQFAVMKTRMQPIKKVFGRFPRVIRDMARAMKKEINLELVGEETDLDKNLVEALADPLVHLVRNSADHGIEMPDEREAAGKPRVGRVILTASQEGDHIELTIEDDGKGMNADFLRSKVIEKGLMEAEVAARLSNKECYNLIFMPGFSTKDVISDVSGRGVGMDVVKTRISQMNGVVEVDSVEGKGSRIIIKVPLTLAIMPTLMVGMEKQFFAFPLASVVEILDLDLDKTNTIDGREVVIVRDQALQLIHLKRWLVNGFYQGDEPVKGHVVVVAIANQHVGFVVDQLIGQEEVVIKPLGAKLEEVKGLAGATITGDGKIALILDVPGLMNSYAA